MFWFIIIIYTTFNYLVYHYGRHVIIWLIVIIIYNPFHSLVYHYDQLVCTFHPLYFFRSCHSLLVMIAHFLLFSFT